MNINIDYTNEEILKQRGLMFKEFIQKDESEYAIFTFSEEIKIKLVGNYYKCFNQKFLNESIKLYVENGYSYLLPNLIQDNFIICNFRKSNTNKHSITFINLGIEGNNFLREKGYYLSDYDDSYNFYKDIGIIEIEVEKALTEESNFLKTSKEHMKEEEKSKIQLWLD